mmetsp:Transcript_64425/g.72023  ORF Transcript_64425/g.72023 Transcript_64425/m.72023 type:complete len:152 (-) Transcript_64425:1201-1656(-)
MIEDSQGKEVIGMGEALTEGRVLFLFYLSLLFVFFSVRVFLCIKRVATKMNQQCCFCFLMIRKTKVRNKKSNQVKSSLWYIYVRSPFFSFSFLFAFVSLILVLRPNVSIVSGLIVNQPKPIKNGVGLDQERTQREKLQERRKQRVSRMSYR